MMKITGMDGDDERWEDVKSKKKSRNVNDDSITNGFDVEPDFSDTEDFEDDVTDEGTLVLDLQ